MVDGLEGLPEYGTYFEAQKLSPLNHMELLRRIFSHPSLADAPPVLVDVGASGMIHPVWRRIAQFSIGIGFEPDPRETRAAPAEQCFRRWILCDKIIVNEEAVKEVTIYLTKSPFCSSTLIPYSDQLRPWAFADFFETNEKRRMLATTLRAALREEGLERVDWLKCDTQGTDLRIFQSLLPQARAHVLAVEFEPGLIDAYHGEDKLHHVLSEMEAEPFWLAKLEVQRSPRGSMPLLQKRLGARLAKWYPRFGPGAPICANAVYLQRDFAASSFNVREMLLLWVFAMELGQPAFACEVAEGALARTGDPLFDILASESTRRMRQTVWRAVAKRGFEKLFRVDLW